MFLGESLRGQIGVISGQTRSLSEWERTESQRSMHRHLRFKLTATAPKIEICHNF